MSYVIDDASMVWLCLDDQNRIIAMCASKWIAELAAKPLEATIQATHTLGYRLGDVVAVFHE